MGEMMDEQTLTLSELLDHAAAASRLGDLEEAERLFRRATERSPANTRAWLGLAGAVQSSQEKQHYFQKVLEFNPNNGEARAALERLAGRMEGAQSDAIHAVLAESATRGAAEASMEQGAAQISSPNLAAGVGDDHDHAGVSSAEVAFCVNHPDTETTLRCYRCNKPVCTRCVERTPVGYLCKECIRERRGLFYTAGGADYLAAAGVGFVLAAVAAPFIGFLLGMFGLFGWLFAFILGPTVGGIAATLIRRAVGRRRGRYMGVLTIGAIILGTLVGVAVAGIFGLWVNVLVLGLFLLAASGTIYATLR